MWITGPKYFIEKKLSVFLIDKKEINDVEIIHVTEPDIVLFGNGCLEYPIKFRTEEKTYDKYRRTKYKFEIVKDICIAFASFQLTPYVLLEIVDWLPGIIFEKHIRKINLIISMGNSIRNVTNNRGNEKNIKIK
jgi:hypothetical protein